MGGCVEFSMCTHQFRQKAKYGKMRNEWQVEENATQ